MNHSRIRALSAPSRLDINASEHLVKTLSIENPADEAFLLDLSSCRQIEIGAGYRLGNALRRFSGLESFEIAFPESFNNSPERWIGELLRSGLALALITHRLRIGIRGHDVTDEVKTKLRASAMSLENTASYLTELHRGAIPVDDLALFSREFNQQLLRVGADRSLFARDELGDLTNLCFETVQNIADHAARQPLPPHTEILSYFSTRLYDNARGPSAGPFTGYLKRVRAADNRFSKDPLFLEFVINDDGVGIPARQELNAAIYFDRYDKEERALVAALAAGGSVKLTAKDTVVRGGIIGQGTTKINESLTALGAFAMLRTGRSTAIFDGLAYHQNEFKPVSGFRGAGFGFMPGTALQIVVPLSR